MTTWVARRLHPRNGQQLDKHYLRAEGNQVVSWNELSSRPEPIGEKRAKISDRYVSRLARNELHATQVAKAELNSGQYYPRIWRGERHFCVAAENDEEGKLVLAIQAAGLLFDRLRDIFRVIQPDQQNRRAYGHEIRSQLMLACTEAESGWKAILKGNGARPTGRTWNTTDYVKLIRPLRLNEWAVAMPLFPAYGGVAPFRGWHQARPTKSLRWYEAYNATKHDREGAFAQATLEALVTANAAVFVTLAAQVGPQTLREAPYSVNHFVAYHTPSWRLSEMYIPSTEFEAPTHPQSRRRPRCTPVPYFGQSRGG